MVGYQMPIEICEPRFFVLDPIINVDQALTQAGAHKNKAFGFNLRGIFQRGNTSIEPKLLQRRLVPFWHLHCLSYFDYSRLNNYEIPSHHPDAVKITFQGPQEQTLDFRVDKTGRSGSHVSVTGIERCITERSNEEWSDAYVKRDADSPQETAEENNRMRDYILQRPRPIDELNEFVNSIKLDGESIFDDTVETIVVPPLETMDNVVRRGLKKVMISIDAPTIHEAYLRVEKLDLYFRPLFVFQFDKLDSSGNRMDRNLEELDALNRDRWTHLSRTEYQMSRLPWTKILKLSADIGTVLLQDVPVAGTAFKVTGTILEQGPSILDDIKRTR